MENLRDFRKTYFGGSMRSMAKDMEISPSYYQQLEYGTKPITPIVMEKLYNLFKMHADEKHETLLDVLGFKRCEVCGRMYKETHENV